MNNLISPGVMHGIRQIPINGKILKNCAANRNLLAGWIHEDQGEVASVAWFQKVLGENPRYEQQLVWESADLLNPRKRNEAAVQAMADSRRVFSEAARSLRRFGDSEANFRFTVSVLGNSFNGYQLQQALDAGALRGLSTVGVDELERWKQEQITQENEFLAQDQTTPHQMQQAKEIRMRRLEDSRRTAAQVALERDLVVGYEREVRFGGKQTPLPHTWNGQSLTPEFIKKADKTVLKALISRFGSAQVTARLQSIDHASTMIDRGDGRGPVLVEVEFL